MPSRKPNPALVVAHERYNETLAEAIQTRNYAGKANEKALLAAAAHIDAADALQRLQAAAPKRKRNPAKKKAAEDVTVLPAFAPQGEAAPEAEQ